MTRLLTIGVFVLLLVSVIYFGRQKREEPVHAATSIVASAPTLKPSAELTKFPTLTPVPQAAVAEMPKVETILNPSLPNEQRRKALFALTQAGAEALPALRDVLLARIPDSNSQREFEVTLRITALEALDALAESGVDVGDVFAKSYSIHQDLSLKTLSMAGAAGVEEGRPGRARRLIQEMVKP